MTTDKLIDALYDLAYECEDMERSKLIREAAERLQTVATMKGQRNMKNKRIRVAMAEAELHQWELAQIMGLHEGSLSRRLRNELPAEEQDRIVELIRQHAKGKVTNE